VSGMPTAGCAAPADRLGYTRSGCPGPGRKRGGRFLMRKWLWRESTPGSAAGAEATPSPLVDQAGKDAADSPGPAIEPRGVEATGLPRKVQRLGRGCVGSPGPAGSSQCASAALMPLVLDRQPWPTYRSSRSGPTVWRRLPSRGLSACLDQKQPPASGFGSASPPPSRRSWRIARTCLAEKQALV